MYEQYFGFTEKPFSLTPDPKYLFRSEPHSNALDLLQHAINRHSLDRRSLVVVTGDIGTGKTMLLRTLLDQTDRKTFTALLLNPFVSEEDLLRAVLHDFGVLPRSSVRRGGPQPSQQDLGAMLREFLAMLAAVGGRAVLVIDEAQNLPAAILEQVCALANPESPGGRLQVILAGQSNLVPALRSPALRDVDDRIAVRFHLAPLVDAEVSAYVAHRLAVANASRPVTFTAGALRHVHHYSGGIPRVINLLCDRCLLLAYETERTRITGRIVTSAARGLDLQCGPPPRHRWFTRLRRLVGLVPRDEPLHVSLNLT
jgi:general secretion pathway protein A